MNIPKKWPPLHLLLDRNGSLGSAPVVRKVDNAIHWINHYPLGSVIGLLNIDPLDTLKQPGPGCLCEFPICYPHIVIIFTRDNLLSFVFPKVDICIFKQLMYRYANVTYIGI